MATVNFTEPSSIVAAENPIVIDLSTAATESPTNTSARTRLNVDGLVRQNFTVRFNLTAPSVYQVSFTARDFPDKDSYFLSKTLKDQYGVTVTANTTTQIAESLADSIQKDPVIPETYFVSYTGGTYIDFLAKSPGERYNLDTSQIILLNETGGTASSGMSLTVISTGNQYWEGDEIADYSLWVDVYTSFSPATNYGSTLVASNFCRQTSLMLPFSSPENKHVFDIKEICKSFLSTPKPDFDYQGSLFQDNYMRTFYCAYGDSYPLIQNTSTKKRYLKGRTNYFWACNACLDWQQANDLTDYTGSTSGGYFINTKFLTNSPSVKKTNRGQKEYLYFLAPENISTYANGNLELTANITFWDGTIQNNAPLNQWKNILATGITGYLGGCYNADVSYDNMGLDALELSTSKRIKRADLRIKSYVQPFSLLTTSGSCQLVQEGFSGQVWSTAGSCHRENLIAVSPTTTRRLILPLDSIDKFYVVISGFSSTLISGATDYGTVTLRFLDSGSTAQQIVTFDPTSAATNYTFNYTGAYPITRIDMRAEAINFGNQKTRFQFTDSGGITVYQRTLGTTQINFSESKTYEFPYTDPSNRFGIVFQNRLGTYDSFEFIGLKEDSFDRSKKDLTLPVIPQDDGSYPEGFKSSANYDIQLTKKIVVNSGFVNQATFDWLQELFNSTEIYSYTDRYINYLLLDGYKYTKSNASSEYNVECTFIATLYNNGVTV